MSRLQNYINTEETEQAKDNGLIDTQYKGTNSEIRGRKGQAFFVPRENKWYFSACDSKIPENEREWYRVNENSLDFEY